MLKKFQETNKLLEIIENMIIIYYCKDLYNEVGIGDENMICINLFEICIFFNILI